MSRRTGWKPPKATIDPKEFWQVQDPGVEEKLALDLARQFARDENPNYVSISWACQERAIKLVNELGFVKALDLLRFEDE